MHMSQAEMIDCHLECYYSWKSQHPSQAAQRLLVFVMASGNRRRSLVLPHFSHLLSRPILAMPTFLSIVLFLFGLFFVHLLLGLRRAVRDVG